MLVEMNGTHDGPSAPPSALPSATARASSHGERDTRRRRVARALAAPAAAALLVALLCGTASAQRKPPAPRGIEEVTRAPVGEWTRERVPAGWILIETRTYQLQSRLDAERTSLLGRHLELLFSLYRDLAPAPASTQRLVVKLLADEEEYRAYGKGGSRYGRYDSDSGEVVVWNTRVILGRGEVPSGIKLARDRVHTLTFGQNQSVLHLIDEATLAYTPDLSAVLARYTWRQYLDQRLWPEGGPELPAWLDQGLAEYFASANADTRDNGKMPLNPARVRELGWLRLDGEARPVAGVLLPAEDDPPFAVGPGPLAQGWSLVYFLLEEGDANWRPLVPQLLEQLELKRSYRQVAEAVFAHVDFKRLQNEWEAWAQGLQVADPLARLARDFGDKVRPEQLVGDEDLRKQYSWLWRRRGGPQTGDQPESGGQH